MLFEGSIHRGVEQWLARQAHNLEAVGSNPIPATKKIRDAFICIVFYYLLQYKRQEEDFKISSRLVGIET